MEKKKMTLRLQWYDLSAKEAKSLSGKLEEMAKDIFEGERTRFHLPWKSKKDLRILKKWNDMQFLVRRKYNPEGLYSLYCSISHPEQTILEKYKGYLEEFYTNTSLFAGYLLYETHHLGVHGYYHLFPAKVPVNFKEERYLVGYEWAGYLSPYLVNQLRDEEIAQLESYANVIKINGGFYYQSNCEITAFGEKEKKIYKEIFQTILKPGFQYMPTSAPLLKTMCPEMEYAYLMQSDEKKDVWDYIGFFYKMRPEDTPIYHAFNNIKRISLKDDV